MHFSLVFFSYCYLFLRILASNSLLAILFLTGFSQFQFIGVYLFPFWLCFCVFPIIFSLSVGGYLIFFELSELCDFFYGIILGPSLLSMWY